MPTIRTTDFRDGGHGASAPLPTLRFLGQLRRLRLHRAVAELGQPIRQPQRRGAGIGGRDQRHFGPVDRRKTILARSARDGRPGSPSRTGCSEAHAGGDRGLDAGARLEDGIGHVPATARRFPAHGSRRRGRDSRCGKPISGTEPVRVSTRMALAGDPVHALRPHRDAALFAGGRA